MEQLRIEHAFFYKVQDVMYETQRYYHFSGQKNDVIFHIFDHIKV